MTYGLGKELAAEGSRVNAVSPGQRAMGDSHRGLAGFGVGSNSLTPA